MALRDLKIPDDDQGIDEEKAEPCFSPYILKSPILGEFDTSVLHQPQGPDSGINAIIGKWPGDETDEEIMALLEELS